MKRLRWYDFISINLFWLGLNIRNNAVQSIFLPYLVDLFVAVSIRNSALGFVRAAGLIIAMLAQPVFGILSDRNTSRYGRRRPYIFIGVILDCVFLVLIAMAGNYWMLMISILLIQISSNISHGPLQALIPDLVPEDQRGVASAVKSIFELLPLLLLGFTIAAWVGAGKFDLAVIVTGLALLILMLLTMILVKEKPITEKPDVPLKPAMLRVLGMLAGIAVGALAGLLVGGLVGGLAGLIVWPIKGAETALAVLVAVGGVVSMIVAVVAGVWAGTLATLGQDARRQPSFTWWVVNRLMFLAAVTSIQSFAPYFLTYAFDIDMKMAISMYGKLIMIVGLFTLLSAIPSGWLSDRTGQKQLVRIAGAIAAIATLVLLLTVWIPNLALIYIVGIFLGIATGLFVTTNWALGTRLVPDEQAGRYLGISNLAGAGAGIIGAGIGGLVADYLNSYSPGLGYFVIFGAYALLFLLSILSLMGVQVKK
jgi:MFS family permease